MDARFVVPLTAGRPGPPVAPDRRLARSPAACHPAAVPSPPPTLAAVLVAGAFALASLPSGEAHAKRKSAAVQAQRFERAGKKAYGLKRWDDAIAAFKLAYEANPRPRYLWG